MGYTIPTKEPLSLRAGDTWQWTRSLPSYPASTWTLTYTAWNPTHTIEIEAAADGDSHQVAVAPQTTNDFNPGRYEWIGRVSNGTDTHTVLSGVWTVLPAIGAPQDTRSHARIMLAAIEAMLEGRATDADLDVVRSQYPGHSVDFRPEDLRLWHRYYAAQVAAEDEALAAAAGRPQRRFIHARFTR